NLKSYEKALDEDLVAISGRFGRFLHSELSIGVSAILAVEWPLSSSEEKSGILLELPEEGKDVLAGIRLRGTIDRVELIPIPDTEGKYVDEGGSNDLCPLDLDKGENWTPRRLVIIRDLKSLEGPSKGDAGKRHQRELLEGIQLALYARAWEVEHPGDRVVGVGIAEIGEESGLYIEADPDYHSYLASLGIGEIACNTETLFRRPNESAESPHSNSFRAWVRHRLTAALRIGQISEEGCVIPTPSGITCTYCSVKQVCGLAPTVGGDRKWN
ncbi:MAG: PD-(D/E)XK nuclease family protein, partial [Candidatus Thalassarchaeaceae archaeon]|nr:PD-(D/E)XK nuclease family protein [Candidatus Thalassarchaeaceae archaeon]